MTVMVRVNDGIVEMDTHNAYGCKKIKLNKLSRKLYPDSKVDGDYLLVKCDEPVFTAPSGGVYVMDYSHEYLGNRFVTSTTVRLDLNEEFDVSFKIRISSRFQIQRIK